MTWTILIAHADNEEALAEQLEKPLRDAGYKVAHRGTVLVGQSVYEEASKVLSSGGPMVVCGTIRAIGTAWARRLIGAARGYKTRIFVLKMEAEADTDQVTADTVVGEYWRDPVGATRQLIEALKLYFPPPAPEELPSKEHEKEARSRYLAYLEAECSEIELDGLPVDQYASGRRLALEKLFVPLRLVPKPEDASDEYSDEHGPLISERNENSRMLSMDGERRPQPSRASQNPRPVGELLSDRARVAVLAPPGGGKSTLIKSLAIAYAWPERRRLIDERLPARSWLPILIRCRELGDMAEKPTMAILHAISSRASMPDHLSQAFSAMLDRELHAGQALLLIDGLDELTDEGRRRIFVRNLRTFLAMHPEISLVLTSREAGFRIVGEALARECRPYLLAEFDEIEIQRLVAAWHKEIGGPRQGAADGAEDLTKTILANDRIRQFAGNPLLLTTLLLVNRCIGQLPSKRSALYDKAIEVLLMSWNVEAHGKLDPDEVVPQLAFVAFSMMKAGVQRISEPELKEALELAREQMPDVLSHAELGVGELIKRVEYRSSLLMHVGQVLKEGRLCALYEFRHITFQEYLAALAVAKGFYPDRQATDTVRRVLEPHFYHDHWSEVIPLAAVLAGRRATDLIEGLIEGCEGVRGWRGARPPPHSNPATKLVQCLIDEVQLPPDVAERALQSVAGTYTVEVDIYAVSKSRYGDALYNVLRRRCDTEAVPFGFLLSQFTESMAIREGIRRQPDHTMGSWIFRGEFFSPFLDDADEVRRAAAALVVAQADRDIQSSNTPALARTPVLAQLALARLNRVFEELPSLLGSTRPLVHYASCRAFTFAVRATAGTEPVAGMLPRLAELWRGSTVREVREAAGTAIVEMPFSARRLAERFEPDSEMLSFVDKQATGGSGQERFAALKLAYFWRQPWSDEDLAPRIAKLSEPTSKRFMRPLSAREAEIREQLLRALGPAGEPYLAK